MVFEVQTWDLLFHGNRSHVTVGRSSRAVSSRRNRFEAGTISPLGAWATFNSSSKHLFLSIRSAYNVLQHQESKKPDPAVEQKDQTHCSGRAQHPSFHSTILSYVAGKRGFHRHDLIASSIHLPPILTSLHSSAFIFVIARTAR